MVLCTRISTSLLRFPFLPLYKQEILSRQILQRFHVKYISFHQSTMDAITQHSRQDKAVAIFNTAVDSVLPHKMIKRVLKVDNNVLHVENKSYALHNNVHVVGFGKAVAGMARTVDELLGNHIVEGIISVPYGLQQNLKELEKDHLLVSQDSNIKMCEGARNNLPDQDAMNTAQAIQRLVSKLTDSDLLLVLISGGGSSLLPLPCPGISLSDMVQLTSMLSRAGATIIDLNVTRKQVEVLKGGGLAKEAAPAQVISLILSDVVGDKLDIIASSPTVADDSSPEACLHIIRRLNLTNQIPPSIKHYLDSKVAEKHWESIGNDKKGEENKHVQNVIVGSNSVATNAACEKAVSMGYLPFLLSTSLEGDARERGKMFGRLGKYIAFSYGPEPSYELRQVESDLLTNTDLEKSTLNTILDMAYKAHNFSQGLCLIASGETTVQVQGKGRGGRNQEMAIACAIELDQEKEKFSNFHIQFLSGGTDGQDGPTDAAGAVVDQHFVQKCTEQSLDIHAFLQENDSYNLLKNVRGCSELLQTGLTGTNVMDVQVLTVTKISK